MIKFEFIDGKGIISGSKFAELREYFSVPNEAAKYNKNFYVPKRLYLIGKNGSFDIGMYSEIESTIKRKYPNEKIELSDEFIKNTNPKLDKAVIERLNKDFRYYQKDSLIKSFDNGRGVLLLGTGAGKTLTCAGLIDNFYLYSKNLQKFKCLVIVPNVGLASQTYKDFISYGVSFSCSLWTGQNDLDPDANVIVANTKIIQSRLDQNKWIFDVDLLIVDECHGLKATSDISKIVSKIKTPNKFGLTGTLPENLFDKWNVIGKLGPVIIEKSSSELREEKFLTNANVKIFNIDYESVPVITNPTGNITDKYYAELEFIYNNKYRNKIIKSISYNFKNNLLILVNHLDHGNILNELLSKMNDKKVFYIKGEVEVDDREKVQSIMESDNNVICIAMSSIFSTGINIKNIHGILFAAGGKSFVRTVQTIGRGLRLNENKINLMIIDIIDNLYYGKKHGIKRKEIYKNENIPYNEYTMAEKSNLAS